MVLTKGMRKPLLLTRTLFSSETPWKGEQLIQLLSVRANGLDGRDAQYRRNARHPSSGTIFCIPEATKIEHRSHSDCSRINPVIANELSLTRFYSALHVGPTMARWLGAGRAKQGQNRRSDPGVVIAIGFFQNRIIRVVCCNIKSKQV